MSARTCHIRSRRGRFLKRHPVRRRCRNSTPPIHTSRRHTNPETHHVAVVAVHQNPFEGSFRFSSPFDKSALVFIRLMVRFFWTPKIPVLGWRMLSSIEPQVLAFFLRVVETEPNAGWYVLEVKSPRKETVERYERVLRAKVPK